MLHRETKSDKDAWECFVSAFVYFFRKRPLKTGLFVILFFGAPGIVAYQYFTTDRVKIEEAKPMGQNIQFEVMSKAYAGDQGIPIIWNNEIWGYEDTNYAAKIVKDAPIVLIYDKITKKVWKSEFTTDRYKSSK